MHQDGEIRKNRSLHLQNRNRTQRRGKGFLRQEVIAPSLTGYIRTEKGEADINRHTTPTHRLFLRTATSGPMTWNPHLPSQKKRPAQPLCEAAFFCRHRTAHTPNNCTSFHFAPPVNTHKSTIRFVFIIFEQNTCSTHRATFPFIPFHT